MRYTEEEKKYLIKNKDKPRKIIVLEFNNLFANRKRTYTKIEAFYKYYKLSSANTGGFQKGHFPWNKGIKGIHLNPKNEFKKGKNINIYLDKNVKNKKEENRLEVTPRINVIVNKNFKTIKNQPELNKAIYLLAKLKYYKK